jgi:hypothetical protein
MALALGHLTAASDASSPPLSPDSKVRICVIIAGKPSGKSWALSEADLAPIMKRLTRAEKNLGNVEFVIGRASNAEQTAQLLDKAGPDAPVLAVSADIFGLSNFNSENAVMPAIFKQGRPVAVFHMPIIGGHDWCLVNPWRQEGHRITLFNTSDYDELERAASLLRVIPLLRRSRVLVSPPFKGTPESYTPEKVKQRLGVEMVAIADGRYDEVMAKVDDRAAKAKARRWLDEAEGIIEPNQEDVLKAARASLTLDQLIAENRIDGLCVGTCMGWLSRGFPCLGFSRLNGRGIPAACDLLRRHAEMRGGAVTEVHYRIGQKVTFTKLVHLDTLLMFTGKIIEVPRVPKGQERGCRTELVAEVEDADKLLANWGGGVLGDSAKDYYASLHRVAYYGDHTQSIRHLAHLMGLKVVQEG